MLLEVEVIKKAAGFLRRLFRKGSESSLSFVVSAFDFEAEEAADFGVELDVNFVRASALDRLVEFDGVAVNIDASFFELLVDVHVGHRTE